MEELNNTKHNTLRSLLLLLLDEIYVVQALEPTAMISDTFFS